MNALGGSQQLRLFRRAIRDGTSLFAAAELAGMSPMEAKLHFEADVRDPPPAEAFELLYDPSSTAAKEADMGRPRRMAREPETGDDDGTGGGVTGEYKRPDAKKAIKIYREEIAGRKAHMAEIRGDLSDPFKRIKDDCKFPRTVLDFLMKVDDLEEAKRDHWLLALNLGLKELKLTLPRDIVTLAEGEDGGEVVPTGDVRPRPNLVAVGDEDDFDGPPPRNPPEEEG